MIADKRNWEKVLIRIMSFPKTRFELRRKLLERGCPKETAEALLDHFQKLGLIDDRSYALLYIDSKTSLGIRRIRDELRAKGVSAEDVDLALSEIEVDEDQRAEMLVMSLCRLEGMTKEKLIGRLARRGFSYSSITYALMRLREEGIRLAVKSKTPQN